MAGTEFSALVHAPGEQLKNDWHEVTLANAEAFGVFAHQQADNFSWLLAGIKDRQTQEKFADFDENADRPAQAQTAMNLFLRGVIGRMVRAELAGIL